MTGGNTDEPLARHMISESKEMLDWIAEQGVRFQPSLGGTLSLGRTNSFFLGGGRAMLNALYRTAERLGVEIAYETEVVDLDISDGMFLSATVARGAERVSLRAGALVAACGGFEANIDWLKQYWGPPADNFLVRGTPHNRGTILKVLSTRASARSAIRPNATPSRSMRARRNSTAASSPGSTASSSASS